ncbi:MULTISPECIES: branched-chain amino acid ABC transporter permease [Bradyrhizobium]|uniref:Branched-chain amino acid ABC transporter permease n=1 Tax=Bradyrhizobium zhengyangense TaxID=2911009 RepID=A0A9X1UAQ1_9BRAD|nr:MULTISPECIES: branched-chain amino acid ABC transporter permease [Bradyrhizobium]MCG2628258.1 branched-chain amino acid ABC transporter permease [Bradyrhizobium zhengyangense]MCG2643377.1 branched-chain amino acid ABC transporter permease [Bradyrhizobium zhengyangense]MCG2670309.1 branched-chain amino acid ABC transporter permease [Bradyrhizobium zhengyangense]MDN4985957.1 branched-chain amino acid ABC transporter permease [Bradyrhizobium sp. WYCCWR 13022]MDN5002663.1 branched-chain amino a
MGLSDALVWALAIFAYFFLGAYHQLGTQVIIMIILALSLDLAIGYSGIESLGHAVFFGIGAYAAALFALNVLSEPLTGLVVGGLAAGAFGFVTGLLVLRVRGLTQVILTIAIGAVVLQVATTWKSVTGGDDGLAGYQVAPILGRYSFDLYGHTAYLYSLCVLAFVFALARILVNSPFGYVLRGIRDNDQRMRMLGVPVAARLLLIYSISAAIAGVAGAISAQVTGLVATDSLSFLLSGNVLIMLLIGGMGRLTGAFIGGIIFVIFSDRAAAIDPFNWLFMLGGLLILAVRFTPQGVGPWIDRMGGYLLDRRRKP